MVSLTWGDEFFYPFFSLCQDTVLILSFKHISTVTCTEDQTSCPECCKDSWPIGWCWEDGWTILEGNRRCTREISPSSCTKLLKQWTLENWFLLESQTRRRNRLNSGPATRTCHSGKNRTWYHNLLGQLSGETRAQTEIGQWYVGPYTDKNYMAIHTSWPLSKPKLHVGILKTKLGGQGHWTSLFPFPVWTHWGVPFLSFLLLFIHLVGKGMSEDGWGTEFRSSALSGLRHPNSRNNSYLGLGAQTNFFSSRFSFSVVFCYCNRKETKIRVICRGVGTLLGLHHWGTYLSFL